MTQPRPLANPPNPWLSTTVDWIGEPPSQPVRVYEDHTRNILAKNDSPDVGFNYSVNPYRGCQHSCSYCSRGETRILMADGRPKAIGDVRAGEEIYGTVLHGGLRRYKRTRVLAHWMTRKPAYRVVLEDGTDLVTSGDHRFLTNRGWKHVVGAGRGPGCRPHLTLNNELLGTGRFATGPFDTGDYRRGYLCGLIRGDGLIGTYDYSGRRRPGVDVQHQFRLALIDLEALSRAQRYLLDLEITTHEFLFQAAVGDRLAMQAIRTHSRSQVDRIRELISWPEAAPIDWAKGFLAGIFDAEGSYSGGILRIANTDETILARTRECLRLLGFDTAMDTSHREHPCHYVRVRRGLREHLRFFHTVDPAITRKRDIEGLAIKNDAPLRVVAIEPLGVELPLYDITTGTEDFIAEGVVSHNCYARPSHEYLGFGAGTDFDTQIVVKPHAPELLREAFEKKSWQGELVMFSGVTDCYQPLEASYRITRGCLEVCAEYRNPAAVITKAPLVERDIDVLQELNRVARVSVTVSVPFWNAEKARAIEPFVATPQRRIKTIERLAAAGIPVGVNVAPVIPGLSDEDMAQILTAAREAGARWAGIVLLRLPGSVKDVFETRIREAMPLRADKILHRIRETRGGLLYDPRWGKRQVGEGEYATMIQTFFDTARRRLGYPESVEEEPAPTTFRRPPKPKAQLDLFGGGEDERE